MKLFVSILIVALSSFSHADDAKEIASRMIDCGVVNADNPEIPVSMFQGLCVVAQVQLVENVWDALIADPDYEVDPVAVVDSENEDRQKCRDQYPASYLEDRFSKEKAKGIADYSALLCFVQKQKRAQAAVFEQGLDCDPNEGC